MTEQSMQEAFEQVSNLRSAIHSIYIGQHDIVDQTLVALFARGHVLLEGVPGLGKTLLVKSVAKLIHSDFSRIQFTPDLMPADVTGHMLYDHHSGTFKVNKGPVFTNLLLADEINRSPAKTQAALLEVMEEHQVTLDGNTMQVGDPFMVLATQNPIEQEGTYNLPEAQLDRFLLKINLDYPSENEEAELLRQIANGELDYKTAATSSLLSRESVIEMQHLCDKILIDQSILSYISAIVRQTRHTEAISYGAGPRGGIALIKSARAFALLNNRDYVTPDDVKKMVFPVLRHRIILSPEYELSGVTTDNMLQEIINKIDAPRE